MPTWPVLMIIAARTASSSLEWVPGCVPSVAGLGNEGESSGPVERESAAFGGMGGGHLSVVKLLVKRGEDIRLKNVDGKTANDVARGEEKEYLANWLDPVRRG